jgi:hypothetical protein
MLGKVIRVVLLVVILGAVGYFGLSIWANCTVFQQAATGTGIDVPEPSVAPYRVHIVNTGRILFADGHTQDGTVHTLHGYWEMVGDEFVRRDHALSLDEALFGAIAVTRR